VPIDDADDLSGPALPVAIDVDAIDVEERLRRVKLAAARPRLRRRLDRLVGEPALTDRVLIAAAGSACATTVVLTYLWWRDGRRPVPGTRTRRLRHTARA
jgi:hypothetical protein